jgi:hypothetical protein
MGGTRNDTCGRQSGCSVSSTTTVAPSQDHSSNPVEGRRPASAVAAGRPVRRRASRAAPTATTARATTGRSRSPRVDSTLPALAPGVRSPAASRWYWYDCAHTSPMPQGTWVRTTTPSVAPAAASRWRGRRAASRTRASGTTAPANRALIETAAPRQAPAVSAHRREGERRYTRASATVAVARARAGPSAAMGAVTHSTLPVAAVSPAASTARGRSVSSRAAAYTASTRPTPEARAGSRGASRVRNPTRSNTHTSGRNRGPWLEKTSR